MKTRKADSYFSRRRHRLWRFTPKGSLSPFRREEFARLKLQGWIRGLLEEEITDVVGRDKSQLWAAVDAPAG